MGLLYLERNAFLPKNRVENSQQLKVLFKHLFYKYIKFVLITFLLELNLQSSHSAEVSFSWNDTEGATGYKIYYGNESRTYTFEVDVGLCTQCTISNLDSGQIYYFAITAYNESEESEFSDELTYGSNTCDTDIDGDGDIDGSDLKSIIAGSSEIYILDFAASFGTEDCAVE